MDSCPIVTNCSTGSSDSPESMNNVSIKSGIVSGLRFRISQEILDSERKYCSTLSTLLNHFLPSFLKSSIINNDIIRSSYWSKKLKNFEQIKRKAKHRVSWRTMIVDFLFEGSAIIPSCVHSIYSVHCQFLHQLECKLISSRLHCPTGQLFSSVILSSQNLLNEYEEYFSGFSKSVLLLKELADKNSEFKDLMNILHSHECCEGLDINAFLLTPIQRIPRYVLLFKQLLLNTQKDDADYSLVESCLQRLTDFLTKLNSLLNDSDESLSTSADDSRISQSSQRNKRSVVAIHLSRLSFRTGSMQEKSGSKFSRALVAKYKIVGKENRYKQCGGTTLCPLSNRISPRQSACLSPRMSPRHSFRGSQPNSLQRLSRLSRSSRVASPLACRTPPSRRLAASKIFNRSALKRQPEKTLSQESLNVPETKRFDLNESIVSADHVEKVNEVCEVSCSPVARLFISDRMPNLATTETGANMQNTENENNAINSKVENDDKTAERNICDNIGIIKDLGCNIEGDSNVGTVNNLPMEKTTLVDDISRAQVRDHLARRPVSVPECYSNSFDNMNTTAMSACGELNCITAQQCLQETSDREELLDQSITDESVCMERNEVSDSCTNLPSTSRQRANDLIGKDFKRSLRNHIRRSSCDIIPSMRNSLMRNFSSGLKNNSVSSPAVGLGVCKESQSTSASCADVSHVSHKPVIKKPCNPAPKTGLSRKVSIKDSIRKLFNK